MDKIALITAPFSQLNAPYPATPFLSGTLNKYNYDNIQIDLSIETAIKFFSRAGLTRMFKEIKNSEQKLSDELKRAVYLQDSYIDTIESVIRFLQDKDSSLAYRIINRDFLPEGSRFKIIDEQNIQFSELEIADGARYLASLYIDDLVDIAQNSVLPHFGLSKYREKLAMSATDFSGIETALMQEDDFITELAIEELQKYNLQEFTLICFTIPFPGNLYSSLKLSQWLKSNHPHLKIAIGGGFVNTELRQLSDPGIFKFVDYIILDDGEQPLLSLLEYLNGNGDKNSLCRTYLLDNGKVQYFNNNKKDLFGSELGLPTYQNLPLDKYFTMIESTNPMHRLWSERGWVKLRLAHGCYWHRCAFCDVSLDYICNYKTMSVAVIVDQIESLVKETGISGIHFVDEAIPPALIKKIALELISRKIKISWWGNIRFEEAFSEDLCLLLREAGCVAVVGGLEAVTDRLLKLMDKGVDVANVARVCRNFTNAGILVHTYLIYCFPTQSIQETIDALEIVRQLFANNLVHSAFWHRFSLTVHSLIAKEPAKYGIKITGRKNNPFANNDIDYIEKNKSGVGQLGSGLKKAVYNFMYGIGIETDVRSWFDPKVPKTTLNKNMIANYLQNGEETPLLSAQIIWLGGKSFIDRKRSSKKDVLLVLPGIREVLEYELPKDLALWLLVCTKNSSVKNVKDKEQFYSIKKAGETFPTNIGISFDDFRKNELWFDLKKAGLLII